MPYDELPEELKQLEAALASLAPAASRVDRDQVMFRLGQLAATSNPTATLPVQRPSFRWQPAAIAAAACLLVASSFGLGMNWGARRAGQTVVAAPSTIPAPAGQLSAVASDSALPVERDAITSRRPIQNAAQRQAEERLLAWADPATIGSAYPLANGDTRSDIRSILASVEDSRPTRPVGRSRAAASPRWQDLRASLELYERVPFGTTEDQSGTAEENEHD